MKRALLIVLKMSTQRIILVIAILLCCISIKVNAAKYYVNDNWNGTEIFSTVAGNNAFSGTLASQPKRSLRAIWTSVGGTFSSGDTIFVDAGTYGRAGVDALTNESKFDIASSGLVIIGAGMGVTVFDNNFYGTNSDYFLWIKASNVTLKNFTVTNYEGGAPNSGGTYATVNNGAQAISIGGFGTISNVTLENINVYDNGGNGNAAITVSQNTQAVLKGGGSMCNSTGSVYSGGVDVRGNNVDLLITNYILAFNQKSGFDGGGLYVFGDNTTIVKVYNTKISDNIGGQGGGAGIYLNGGNMTVRNCLIKSNLVSTVGGPYYVGSGIGIVNGTMTLAKSKIESNMVAGSSTADFGGVGIYPLNGNIVLNIDSCHFLTNNGARATGKDLGARINSSHTFSISVNQTTFATANPIEIGGGSTNSCSGNSFVIRRSGNPSITLNGSPSCVLGAGSNTLAPTQLYVPNPSNFSGVCGSIAILPIEFIDFTGSCEKTHAKLEWSTASEHNNDFFTIERAGSDAVFFVLAQLGGKLNTTQKTAYAYADYYAEEGINYYRLSQTDVNGAKRELKTISLNNNCLTASGLNISSSYNSTNNSINLGFKFEDNQLLEASLYNAMGQVVQTTEIFLKASERFTEINLLNSFSDGIYFLKLSNSSILFSDKILISK